jgi:hypothetical protein
MSRLSKYAFSVFALASVMLLTFALECFSQSIADVAREERERRKNIQGKLFIQNLRTTAGETAASPDATAAPAPAAAPTQTDSAKKPAGPTDNRGRDEKYWRAAFQKARDDAKRAADRTVLLDLQLKELNTQLLRQSDMYNRENRIGAAITAAQKELETAQKEAAQAKQSITDLEEELRKSGGLPGWAR